jgi:hypothetical protein
VLACTEGTGGQGIAASEPPDGDYRLGVAHAKDRSD